MFPIRITLEPQQQTSVIILNNNVSLVWRRYIYRTIILWQSGQIRRLLAQCSAVNVMAAPSGRFRSKCHGGAHWTTLR